MLMLYGAVCDARVAEKQNGQGSKIEIMHVGKTGCMDCVTAGE